MNNGSDGTLTDMWVMGAAAGLRRGYNVLIFDGPGQGEALWRQNLYFRPDWEKVLTPVVDWLLARDDVDPAQLVLIGVSQGGYWVPRALAFEKRFAAAVADPGVMDVATSWTSQMPPNTMDGLLEGTEAERAKVAEEINGYIAEGMAQSIDLRWTVTMRMKPYGLTNFSDMLVALTAYTLRGLMAVSSLGASGATLGLCSAYFWEHRNDRFRFFVLPQDGAHGIVFLALLFVPQLAGLGKTMTMKVDIASHVVGMLAGMLGIEYINRSRENKEKKMIDVFPKDDVTTLPGDGVSRN
jgi:pimeloyl-ACP methyl ester carboxylesterase